MSRSVTPNPKPLTLEERKLDRLSIPVATLRAWLRLAEEPGGVAAWVRRVDTLFTRSKTMDLELRQRACS